MIIIPNSAKLRREFTEEAERSIELAKEFYKVTKREPVRQRPAIKGKIKLVDKRVSVCQECRRGIFEDTDYTWTNTGYRHTGCLNGITS